MKLFILSTLLLTIYSSSASPIPEPSLAKRFPLGVCPPVDPTDNSVYLADSKRCNEFYECTGGVPKLFTCPDGLVFNILGPYCDWPQNVVCAEVPLG